jgi:hypothetical protein
MNERGNQLQETANAQISGLIGLISTRDEAALGPGFLRSARVISRPPIRSC